MLHLCDIDATSSGMLRCLIWLLMHKHQGCAWIYDVGSVVYGLVDVHIPVAALLRSLKGVKKLLIQRLMLLMCMSLGFNRPGRYRGLALRQFLYGLGPLGTSNILVDGVSR